MYVQPVTTHRAGSLLMSFKNSINTLSTKPQVNFYRIENRFPHVSVIYYELVKLANAVLKRLLSNSYSFLQC